jgi:glycosyltransferase involved in cell wall biosynthesis
VQQVSPEHYDAALARGESAERQFLLPHGLDIPRIFAPMPAADRAARRAGLGIPADAPVVLSVGALNASHKRMDYVIDEVATMASQPYLLLLGATGPETAAIRERAASRLGERCVLRTLDAEMMRDVYGVADVFVLASLVEGFGLAQVEALAAGVPCVAHDSPTAAYVLGEHAVLADLRRPGMLAPRLERVLREGNDAARAAKRHAYAWRKFSWDTLADSYASALQDCAAGRRPADASRD